MFIICTNIKRKDFQNIIFEIEGLTWDGFCEKVINCEDFINYIVNTSMEWGSTTIRKYRGKVNEINIKDDIHMRIEYEDGSISEYYKLDKIFL